MLAMLVSIFIACSEAEAYQAMLKFNARWYAGRQISAEFVTISKWKNAICGKLCDCTTLNSLTG